VTPGFTDTTDHTGRDARAGQRDNGRRHAGPDRVRPPGFFAITGADGQSGPRFSVGTFTQTATDEPDPNCQLPHLLVSGAATLLGTQIASIYLYASPSNFTFQISRRHHRKAGQHHPGPRLRLLLHQPGPVDRDRDHLAANPLRPDPLPACRHIPPAIPSNPDLTRTAVPHRSRGDAKASLPDHPR
jgi:hypothetical protein